MKKVIFLVSIRLDLKKPLTEESLRLSYCVMKGIFKVLHDGFLYSDSKNVLSVPVNKKHILAFKVHHQHENTSESW